MNARKLGALCALLAATPNLIGCESSRDSPDHQFQKQVKRAQECRELQDKLVGDQPLTTGASPPCGYSSGRNCRRSCRSGCRNRARNSIRRAALCADPRRRRTYHDTGETPTPGVRELDHGDTDVALLEDAIIPLLAPMMRSVATASCSRSARLAHSHVRCRLLCRKMGGWLKLHSQAAHVREVEAARSHSGRYLTPSPVGKASVGMSAAA
jgi:hypothetical protein